MIVKRPTESAQTSFWFTLTGPWRFPIPRAARQQARGVDHSYALPLSDGHHILFTDNETGLLCLGSDRPTGELQRLSRKFTFHPHSSTATGPDPVPNVYAATKVTVNGLRIAASHGNIIILYSVPGDALRYSTAEQEETIQDSSKPFEELEWLDILPHSTSNAAAVRNSLSDTGFPNRCERLNMLWAHYLPSPEDKVESLDGVWPLRICGTVVGTLEGLKALSIQESPADGLVIWAFGTAGMAKAWEVDGGQRPLVKTWSTVGTDGFVREDTPMTETPGN